MICAVYGCMNSAENVNGSNNIHFFTFPEEERMKKLWLSAILWKTQEPPRGSVICSDHFDDVQFMKSGCYAKRLRKYSVPRILRKVERIFEVTTSHPLEEIVDLTDTDDDMLSTVIVSTSAKTNQIETLTSTPNTLQTEMPATTNNTEEINVSKVISDNVELREPTPYKRFKSSYQTINSGSSTVFNPVNAPLDFSRVISGAVETNELTQENVPKTVVHVENNVTTITSSKLLPLIFPVQSSPLNLTTNIPLNLDRVITHAVRYDKSTPHIINNNSVPAVENTVQTLASPELSPELPHNTTTNNTHAIDTSDTNNINTNDNYNIYNTNYKTLNKNTNNCTVSQLLANTELYLGIDSLSFKDIMDLLRSDNPNGLSIKDDVIIFTLAKLKRNFSIHNLSTLFNISEEKMLGIFGQMCRLLSNKLSCFLDWPSSDKIRMNLPMSFKKNYRICESLIDIFEIRIEEPTRKIHKKLTWSEKSHSIKYLISCTPDGLVNFVSEGFVGSTTIREIVKHSGYLKILKADTGVLATQMFKTIEKDVANQNSIFLRPESLIAQRLLTEREKKINTQRLQLLKPITQLIKRLNQFEIVRSVIDEEVQYYLDDIMIIICALLNLQHQIDFDDVKL